MGHPAAAGGGAAGGAGVPGARVRRGARPAGAGAGSRGGGQRHPQRAAAQRADAAVAQQRVPHRRQLERARRRAARAAPRAGAPGVARQRAAPHQPPRHALPQRCVRLPGPHARRGRREAGLRQRAAPVGPGLFGQLLLAHARRPGHGAHGDVHAGGALGRAQRFSGGHLLPARHPVRVHPARRLARPRPVVQRRRRHPAGAAPHGARHAAHA